MSWHVVLSRKAEADLRKLDITQGRRILKFLRDRIATSDNPRVLGKPLQGGFKDCWRYRFGDYRIICDIQDETITVLVLLIGHRKDIYA